MKVTINKNDILEILSKIQGLTNRKSNLAITANVLIKTMHSQISITATDLETGFEGYYPAQIEEEGIITINSKKLFEIIRDFPSETILIHELENQWIEIGAANVEFHIVGMDHEEFPEIPVIEEIPFFELDSFDFKKMIEKTIMIGFPKEEKRAHIIGVNLTKIEDKKILRMASTDIKRLSKVDIEYQLDNPDFLTESILIPKNSLSEVQKFLDTTGIIQIGVSKSHFIVKKDNETLITGIYEGDFPAFNQLLEAEQSIIIEFDRNLLLMMLKRMSILSTEDYRSVIFSFENNKFIVIATNPDIGESREEMSISYDGESFETAFNPRYFIDALNMIEEDQVLFEFSGLKKPCLVHGKDNTQFINIIMPMKI